MAGSGTTGRATSVEVGGRRLQLTNLDKVLYPATEFTKAQLLRYYQGVAAVLLPHLRDRPLTVRRFPDGVEGEGFYAKHLPRGTPEWVRRAEVPTSSRRGEGATSEFPMVDDEAGLAWMANLAAIELHVPMWRVHRSGRPAPPDLMVLDLDPGPPADIVQCAEVALALRDRLADEQGRQAHPKTSGSKGMQLYVPLSPRERQHRWDDGGTREEARHLAEQLAREQPELVVANMRKDLRKGRVLVDWSQNNVAKTTVAPYSLRATAQPSVSTPVTWEEVERCARRGRPEELRFGPEEVLERVGGHGDLFAPLIARTTSGGSGRGNS